MRTPRKAIARAAAVAGFGVAALLANPAVGSAAVTGTATVTTSGDNIVVQVDDVSSPTLRGCSAKVVLDTGWTLIQREITISGDPGSGTFSTPSMGPSPVTVFVYCSDADGGTELTPPGGVTVAVSELDWVRGGCKGLGSVIAAGPFVTEGSLPASLLCAVYGLEGGSSAGS